MQVDGHTSTVNNTRYQGPGKQGRAFPHAPVQLGQGVVMRLQASCLLYGCGPGFPALHHMHMLHVLRSIALLCLHSPISYIWPACYTPCALCITGLPFRWLWVLQPLLPTSLHTHTEPHDVPHDLPLGAPHTEAVNHAFAGFADCSDQQRQAQGGAGGGLGGTSHLAALQLQPPAGLEQELQHQA